MNPNENSATGPLPQIPQTPQPEPLQQPTPNTPKSQSFAPPSQNNWTMTLFLVMGIITLLVISIILFIIILNR